MEGGYDDQLIHRCFQTDPQVAQMLGSLVGVGAPPEFPAAHGHAQQLEQEHGLEGCREGGEAGTSGQGRGEEDGSAQQQGHTGGGAFGGVGYDAGSGDAAGAAQHPDDEWANDGGYGGGDDGCGQPYEQEEHPQQDERGGTLYSDGQAVGPGAQEQWAPQWGAQAAAPPAPQQPQAVEAPLRDATNAQAGAARQSMPLPDWCSDFAHPEPEPAPAPAPAAAAAAAAAVIGGEPPSTPGPGATAAPPDSQPQPQPTQQPQEPSEQRPPSQAAAAAPLSAAVCVDPTVAIPAGAVFERDEMPDSSDDEDVEMKEAPQPSRGGGGGLLPERGGSGSRFGADDNSGAAPPPELPAGVDVAAILSRIKYTEGRAG